MKLQKHIIELLKRIGLTESEAMFYLAVQQNPNQTIQDIQKRCRISRASAYRAFEHLKELRLLSNSTHNWRKSMEAAPLKNIAEKLAKEQRKLKKIELEIKRLDNLMNLNSSFLDNEDPVQVLVNPNDITEKCFEILHQPWDSMLCYGSAERLIDVIGNDAEREFVKLRVKKGKKAYAILTELGGYTQEFIPHNHRDLRNMKLRVDKTNQDYATYVYGNEVTIWHRDKELGSRVIVIKEPTMIHTYQTTFDMLWKK